MLYPVMQKFPLYQHSVVRDLAWSCFGPNLIDHFESGIRSSQLALTSDRKQGLLELDQNPEPLLTHLSQLKSIRLGLYFEALWTFFLLHDSQLELIANNVPVYKNKITLGELDVVYRDKQSGAFTHLELAVKFYLNTQTSHVSTEMSEFLGPNGKDRLDLKMARLVGHQSPLSNTPEGKQTLADLGIDPVQKEIAVKGRLFYHETLPLDGASENSTPQPLSSHHQRGRWNHFAAFSETAHQYRHWVILDKRNWLSPVTIFDGHKNREHPILTADQLITALGSHFETDQRPLMVCPIEKTDAAYQETARYFITPDQWPQPRVPTTDLPTRIVSKQARPTSLNTQ